MSMRKYIVLAGLQKCATTSLHYYLSRVEPLTSDCSVQESNHFHKEKQYVDAEMFYEYSPQYAANRERVNWCNLQSLNREIVVIVCFREAVARYTSEFTMRRERGASDEVAHKICRRSVGLERIIGDLEVLSKDAVVIGVNTDVNFGDEFTDLLSKCLNVPLPRYEEVRLNEASDRSNPLLRIARFIHRAVGKRSRLSELGIRYKPLITKIARSLWREPVSPDIQLDVELVLELRRDNEYIEKIFKNKSVVQL